MADRIYIVHGDSPNDCEDLRKEKGLDRHKCVYVLRGFEGGKQKDTSIYQHVYRDKK